MPWRRSAWSGRPRPSAWRRASTPRSRRRTRTWPWSFLALAEARGLPVDPARRARAEALAQGRVARAARDFAAGAGSGHRRGDGAGLAGSLAADVTGLGDLRDLLREGGRYARAEPYDPLLLGMALVGLPLTLSTWTAGAGRARARA